MKAGQILPGELREVVLRLIRFTLVGVFSTLVYAVLAFGLEATGTDVLIAHVIASAVSLVTSYVMQKIITFRVRGGHRRNVPRFLIATAVLVTLQTLLVAGLEALSVDNRMTLLASTLFYPAASFIVHNFWTFRAPSEPQR